MVHFVAESTLPPPPIFQMDGRNLGVEPNDLWPTTFGFEPCLVQYSQPVASASPAPESEPTCEAVATFLALLDLVFIAFGTWVSVLSE